MGVMKVTRETKATLTASTSGRVLVWTSDTEKGAISIAVPNDRAVMTATDTRNLAAQLMKMADELDVATGLMSPNRLARPQWDMRL